MQVSVSGQYFALADHSRSGDNPERGDDDADQRLRHRVAVRERRCVFAEERERESVA